VTIVGNNLFGSDISELYLGLGGFDLLFASSGNDTLDGGSDTDVAIYYTG
jgi:Ca2+-binding RTX toxin-like protein